MAREKRDKIKSTSFRVIDIILIDEVVEKNNHKSFSDFIYNAAIKQAKIEKKQGFESD